MPRSRPTTGPERPEPIRVPSDECLVRIGDREYALHRGQSVWIVGTRTVGELQATWAFDRLSVELDRVRGEPNETERSLALLEEHFERMLAWMARRLVRWDWTDATGQPLPPLDGTPEPLRYLSPDEVHYLRRVLRGEVTAEEGNAVA